MISAIVVLVALVAGVASGAVVSLIHAHSTRVLPAKVSFPIEPGQLGVDGNGRRWRIVSRELTVPGPGRSQHLRLDLLEERS